MTILEMLRRAVEIALGRRSAEGVAIGNGLPRKAVVGLLEGRAPGLGRAGEIADALGLELRVHRKGEPLDLHALQLAIAVTLLSETWGDVAKSADLPIDAVMKSAEVFGGILAGAYLHLEPGFRPSECGDPAEQYRRMVDAMSLYHGLGRRAATEAEEKLGSILLASGLASPLGNRGPADDSLDEESA